MTHQQTNVIRNREGIEELGEVINLNIYQIDNEFQIRGVEKRSITLAKLIVNLNKIRGTGKYQIKFIREDLKQIAVPPGRKEESFEQILDLIEIGDLDSCYQLNYHNAQEKYILEFEFRTGQQARWEIAQLE